jgi:hypothetical protein
MVDPFSAESLVPYAFGLLFGLPVAGALVYKVLHTSRLRRERAAMKEGNRIWKEWLDSSSASVDRK